MELGFRLFGLQVQVSLYFLLVGILIRPGETRQFPALTVVWLVVMFVGVLLHELGHALTARWFGQQPAIVLHGLGGLTYWKPKGRISAARHLLISAAGPAVGIVLGLAFLLFQWLLTNPGSPANYILGFVVYVNLGWGLMNLLPVLPLDGGQVVSSLLEILGLKSPRRTVHGFSLVLGVVLAVISIPLFRIDGVLIGALLAWTNYSAWRSLAPQPPAEPPPPAPTYPTS